MGVPPKGGCLHPLLKVRSEFREIFFQMGFTEMETNRYVESSFWNFDALFQVPIYTLSEFFINYIACHPYTS